MAKINGSIVMIALMLTCMSGYAIEETPEANIVDKNSMNEELNRGMLGIPFNVPLEIILNWISSNDATIVNATVNEIKDDIKKRARGVKILAKAFRNKENDMNEIAKEITKLALGAQISDVFEAAALEVINKEFRKLKYPAFEYNGKKYLLSPVLEDAEIDVNESEDSATEKKVIIKNELLAKTFQLVVQPKSGKSPLKKIDIAYMSIYFIRDANNYLSYASGAQFSCDSQNEMITKITPAIDILDKKYGVHVRYPTENEEENSNKNSDICDVVYRLTGTQSSDVGGYYIWNNKVLFTFNDGSAYQIIYYDMKCKTKIEEMFKNAVEATKNVQLKNKNEQENNLEKSF